MDIECVRHAPLLVLVMGGEMAAPVRGTALEVIRDARTTASRSRFERARLRGLASGRAVTERRWL